jgi:23S rRNA pseudouridine2605 synthase
MSEERLQKILAHAGISSRRAAESFITAGRVRVNGRVVTELGSKADPRNDKVELDGIRVFAESPVYIVLHKPRGVVSTMHDPEGRLTVKDYLKDVPGRVYPIGRLDYATSGVLLATNDGELADGLLHPKKQVPKTYIVKVSGKMEMEDLRLWSKGVELEDGPTHPAVVTLLRFEGDKTWIELTIKEGRNQQVRRMGEATGFPVMRLVRASFAGISSEGLKPGTWRNMTRDELMALKKAYGVPRSLPAPVEPLKTETRERKTGRGKPAGVDARGRGRGVPQDRPDARGHEATPRYGGGSPGRRSPDVREDWGGGSQRGRPIVPREADRAPSRGGSSRSGAGSTGRGRSGAGSGLGRGSSHEASGRPGRGAAPEAEQGRGRASRTTGTGGGIGATGDGAGYRMQRGRKR